MSTERRAAVLLARMRAEGATAGQAVSAAVLAAAEQAAERVGRQLVGCLAPVAPDSAASARPFRPALVLGWAEGLAPSPEDGSGYPVRRFSVTQALTWAACLGMAWPDRSASPYPGEPFRSEDVVDLLADLGVPSMWVKAALKHDLPLAGLVARDGEWLRLGPAAAALPDATVEALRRFHDRLPRQISPDESVHHAATSEAWPPPHPAPEQTSEEGDDW
jgi:hypothetical protein